ncbi:MAG: DUF1257 domain-containing protein [Planctomycetaceae bacterium]|nr:DUF1257 domain-containing protein [Planctomycetaceae bacterium]
MSHIVTVTTQIRDPIALGSACTRLSLPAPTLGTVRLFSSEATGHCVRLPNWRYPIVCHLETGQLSYDNYQGHWGDPAQLNRLVQAYAVEKTRLEARRVGHSVVEQTLPDGSIKLTLQTGGAA